MNGILIKDTVALLASPNSIFISKFWEASFFFFFKSTLFENNAVFSVIKEKSLTEKTNSF